MDSKTKTPPSAWVEKYIRLVRTGGSVLDLACGQGRHSLLAAGLGHQVIALDQNADALEHLSDIPNLTTLAHDLEADGAVWPFTGSRFDGIIVTNYLHRPLRGSLLAALSDGGVLIYETFADGNATFGKPSRPDFLLEDGELLDWCRGLTVIAFEQGLVSQPKPAVRQRICAIRNVRAADVRID